MNQKSVNTRTQWKCWTKTSIN